MEKLLTGPLLGKLLDLSVGLFISVCFNIALAYVWWTGNKDNRKREIDHAAELAKLNAEQLRALSDHNDKISASDERWRGVIEKSNAVMASLGGAKSLSEEDHNMLHAIGEKVGVELKDLRR